MPLTTASGETLRVVYGGRHTFDHGPDFRDALLTFDDELVRGDVEIHVRSGDWRTHAHHRDAVYDDVALHVVWHDDGLAAITSAGRVLPALTLERFAPLVARTGPESNEEDEVAELVAGLDPPCRRQEGAREKLLAMGLDRFSAKAAVLEAAMTTEQASQVFYTAILDALGFATNRVPARRLAEAVPWTVVTGATLGLARETRVAVLEALFLGAAGLLPKQSPLPPPLEPEDAAYVELLEHQWAELEEEWRIAPLQRRDWRFSRVRPDNFPPRRLAAASRLLAPFTRLDLAAAFLGVLRSEDSDSVAPALDRALGVPADGYWATHYDFGRRSRAPSQLLGHGRAADIAVNVVLPFAVAYGEATDDRYLTGQAQVAYRSYPPLDQNELTRHVSRLVFGRLRPKGLRAIEQQGLLHAYHQFCKQKRCYDCPLGFSAG